jgi:hypothetical protein
MQHVLTVFTASTPCSSLLDIFYVNNMHVVHIYSVHVVDCVFIEEIFYDRVSSTHLPRLICSGLSVCSAVHQVQ